MTPPTVTSVQGPWARVLDTQRAGKPDPQALRDLVNGVLTPTGAVESRPGFAALAAHPGAPGQAQGMAGMELAGTTYTLAVVGGVLARYDWATDAWTTLTHTGTTINVTGPVWLVPFFDQLIVSDGVNRPWATTIGSGVGTYLALTTDPWYGPPRVKDAKLFGVLATDRRTLIWSEEADPMLGGTTGGYNDAWDLRQTAQGALVALAVDNDAIRYQREGSTGKILGQVNDDFQASGTHDDVAHELGTLSPGVPVLTAGGVLWSVDALGRPYRVGAGTDVDTLWLACQATIAAVDRAQLARAWGLFLPEYDAVAFALPRTAGSAYNTDLLLFDRAAGDYVGRWTLPGGDFAWGARCTDDQGVERLVVLDHAGQPSVLWRDAEATDDAAKALDAPTTGAVTVATRVVLAEAQQAGAEQAAWCQWTDAIVETGDPWGGTMPPVLATAASAGMTLAFDTEEAGHPFGSRVARTIVVGAAGRKQVGLRRYGRWLRTAWTPALGDGTTAGRFRLWRVTLIGMVRDVGTRRR